MLDRTLLRRFFVAFPLSTAGQNAFQGGASLSFYSMPPQITRCFFSPLHFLFVGAPFSSIALRFYNDVIGKIASIMMFFVYQCITNGMRRIVLGAVVVFIGASIVVVFIGVIIVL